MATQKVSILLLFAAFTTTLAVDWGRWDGSKWGLGGGGLDSAGSPDATPQPTRRFETNTNNGNGFGRSDNNGNGRNKNGNGFGSNGNNGNPNNAGFGSNGNNGNPNNAGTNTGNRVGVVNQPDDSQFQDWWSRPKLKTSLDVARERDGGASNTGSTGSSGNNGKGKGGKSKGGKSTGTSNKNSNNQCVKVKPDKILVGYAEQIFDEKELDDCIGRCLSTPSCKSAQFYRDSAQNCILNSDGASGNEALLVDADPFDKTTFIDIVC